MLRTLSSFEKYKTNVDDDRGNRRYSQNILQWSKNDFKSKKTTNGDYSFCRHINLRIKFICHLQVMISHGTIAYIYILSGHSGLNNFDPQDLLATALSLSEKSQ